MLSNPKDGVSASVHVNWITPTKLRNIRVTGTKGVCFADYIQQTCILYGGNMIHNTPTKEFDFEMLKMAYKNTDQVKFGVHKQEPLKVQLHEFYKSLIGKEHNLATAEQASEMVKMADEAISQSKAFKFRRFNISNE